MRRKCPGLKFSTEAMAFEKWEVRGEKWEMIKGFRDLVIYQKSYELSIRVHALTLKYPEYEKYEIGSQIRRAAMSVPLNIAEGYGKKESIADFKRFLRMSVGSCNEIEVLMDMSYDLGYINEDTHKEITEQYIALRKQIISTIEKWKNG